MKLPPGVHQLRSGRYRWRVMVDGRTRTGTADTPAGAALARAQAKLDEGGAPDHDPTVRDLLDAHLAHARRAETTLANWQWARARLPEPFLDRRASEVTPRVVAALWRQLGEAGATPHQLVKTGNLCSTAWREAFMFPNPWADAKPPQPAPSARIDPPTADQVSTLIDAAAELDAQFAVWLTVAAFTGARAGEVCALRWDDCDLEHGEVLILRNMTRRGQITPTKTGRSGQRKVPIDNSTVDAIRSLCKGARCTECDGSGDSPYYSEPNDDDPGYSHPVECGACVAGVRLAPSGPWLFPRADGMPMLPDGAAKRLQRVSRLTGVRVSPHSLRHWFVTDMLANGVSVPDVAAMIGDSPKTVLSVYAHWVPARSRDAVERLGERVRGPSEYTRLGPMRITPERDAALRAL